ncbi:MAG: cupredoxin domain-containing protein [Actinomycetes bacterium]
MRRRMVIGVLAGVLAVVAAGCGGGDDNGGGSASATTAAPETTSAPGTTAAAGGGADDELALTAQGTAWDTTSFDLKSGASYTLEVTNKDSIEHNFTFTEGDANQDIEGGEDAKVTFTAPAAGSYQFICKYHPSVMKGTITVT